MPTLIVMFTNWGNST